MVTVRTINATVVVVAIVVNETNPRCSRTHRHSNSAVVGERIGSGLPSNHSCRYSANFAADVIRSVVFALGRLGDDRFQIGVEGGVDGFSA